VIAFLRRRRQRASAQPPATPEGPPDPPSDVGDGPSAGSAQQD
jgi:hypothetical protein